MNETLGPIVRIHRTFRDKSKPTDEFLPEFLARNEVANIVTDEPNTATAKIFYSELKYDQLSRWTRGIVVLVKTKFFKPDTSIN